MGQERQKQSFGESLVAFVLTLVAGVVLYFAFVGVVHTFSQPYDDEALVQPGAPR